MEPVNKEKQTISNSLFIKKDPLQQKKSFNDYLTSPKMNEDIQQTQHTSIDSIVQVFNSLPENNTKRFSYDQLKKI